MPSQPKPSKDTGSTPGDRRQMGTETEPRQLHGSTMYTAEPENDYTSGCGWRKWITWLSSKVNQIRLPLPSRVILTSKMSHLGLPDQRDTADNTDVSSQEYGNLSTASNMEVPAAGTERLTPVINKCDKTYTPCMARRAFEPMAHSGQNSEVPELQLRGIWASAQPQHQVCKVSDSVPAMCNMALMSSKINMQVHYEDSSEREEF